MERTIGMETFQSIRGHNIGMPKLRISLLDNAILEELSYHERQTRMHIQSMSL